MKYNTQPFPVGICTFFDCTWLCNEPQKWIIAVVLLFFAGLYIAEKAMFISLSGLSLLSILILTLDESNGNPAENGVISLLFIVQFLAYIMHWINPKRNLEKDRIQFSLQIVASVYVLSAISKLSTSGLHWFGDDAQNFILEIQRVYQAKYAATGSFNLRETGDTVVSYFLNHTLLLKAILLAALTIELFAFLLLINQTWALVYGFLLMALHLGIYLVMDLTFPTIMIPMIVVTINPLYWILLRFKK